MKRLKRSEMKNLLGGLLDSASSNGGCSMVYQDANGQWQTETGTCDEQLTGNWAYMVATPFCHTTHYSGPVALTSNGGVSRCGAPYQVYGPQIGV